eukprot:GHVN01086517.1.p1 GENE.GHVN01086517.1~~GHVN01086517.1.p1  ORF type:complete len:131 (-),score=6.14 GHVN01086517.1:1257-1649(-)
MRSRIIVYVHLKGGHQGIKRTVSLVKRFFWWQGLDEDVRSLLIQCVLCDRLRGKTPDMVPGALRAFQPGEVVALDHIGPFRCGEQSKKVLTIIDHFTKYAQAVLRMRRRFTHGTRSFSGGFHISDRPRQY